MLKKLSIRWRLTLMSALLLSICCVGLTFVINNSAFNLADSIEATAISEPAKNVSSAIKEEPQAPLSTLPQSEIQTAKKGFRIQSILYMLMVIGGGSALTYYISGKALKPLDTLNEKVRNINVTTLSETMMIPPTHDEIAELTTSFNDMSNKLNEAFITQKRFSASAAHELRTPLAILQTKIDVFKKKSDHSLDEYETLLTIFEKQTYRLHDLIRNLLDMTNTEEDKEKSNVCLRDLLEEIVNELSTIAKNKHVHVFLNCDDTTVFANVDLLYRAFYNLIENGINYNIEDGNVKIEVIKTRKKQVEIVFRDSGIGIPDDMKKHIFEPFYRVDTSRSRNNGGVGLGLSMVESILKNQGGSIEVLDNENGGSCFKVVL